MLNKIKKHIFKSYKAKSKTIIRNRSVKCIAIIYEKNLDVDLQKAIRLLEDDFTIENLDLNLNVPSKEKINSFDFVLFYTDFKDKAYQFSKRLKVIDAIRGVYIKGEVVPDCNLERIYDLIWFQSYFLYEKIKSKIPKIHALGIDLDTDLKTYKLNTNKHILLSRYLNIALQKIEEPRFNEFYKSPIWDIRYLSQQIRKGVSYYEKEATRRTCVIESSKTLKSGRHSFYNSNLLLTGDEFIEIGSFCSFGKNVAIYTSNHDINYPATQGYIYRKYFNENHPGENLEKPSLSRTKGPVCIKNDVWIGDGVKIMSGVTIGNGACIAAGSIVTSNVDDYSVVAGVPAKRIKYRFNTEVRKTLLDLQWWYWSDSKISKNKAFFNLNLNTITSSNTILEIIE